MVGVYRWVVHIYITSVIKVMHLISSILFSAYEPSTELGFKKTTMNSHRYERNYRSV